MMIFPAINLLFIRWFSSQPRSEKKNIDSLHQLMVSFRVRHTRNPLWSIHIGSASGIWRAVPSATARPGSETWTGQRKGDTWTYHEEEVVLWFFLGKARENHGELRLWPYGYVMDISGYDWDIPWYTSSYALVLDRCLILHSSTDGEPKTSAILVRFTRPTALDQFKKTARGVWSDRWEKV